MICRPLSFEYATFKVELAHDTCSLIPFNNIFDSSIRKVLRGGDGGDGGQNSESSVLGSVDFDKQAVNVSSGASEF